MVRAIVLLTLIGFAAAATPSAADLAYQELEIGAFFQYNIGLYGQKTGNYACGAGPLPPSAFAPSGTINTDTWLTTAKALGAKYALITVQAGCGFLLYPSEVRHSGGPLAGQIYNQTVRESAYAGGDLVKQFVDSCHKYNIRPALYFQAAMNVYCHVRSGIVAGGGPWPCGAQEDYDTLVLGHLSEVWANYGDLVEIWFDGGTAGASDFNSKLSAKINALQPNAIVFGGYGLNITNPIRWIGSESGRATPENWNTDNLTAGPHHDGNGAGVPDGVDFVPAECDVSLQQSGGWYWKPGSGAETRSLEELMDIYEQSVGRNCNLQLGFAPNYAGQLPDAHVDMYQRLGAVIQACYHEAPINATVPGSVSLSGSVVLELPGLPPSSEGGPLKVVLAENQKAGERVRGWRLDYTAHPRGTWLSLLAGEAIGHKRILTIPTNVSSSGITALRLTIVAAAGDTVQIAAFEVRNCSIPSPPAPPSEMLI